MQEDIHGQSELTATEQEAILSNRGAANRPQPVDYGLSYHDLHPDFPPPPRILEERGLRGVSISALGSKFDGGLEYRKTEWFEENAGLKWVLFLGIWFIFYGLGTWTWHLGGKAFFLLFLGYTAAFLIVRGLVGAAASENRKGPLLAYEQAVEPYKAAERQKRSYWEHLNGYEFERATAEALKRHQFNPKLTGGSADGGVDIEVARGGQKGVVQCKAHIASVGPHTVRDLFGVMHHSRADFGIIVSRGGFTKGARDFARNKPIFLVDTSDLIVMQEGQDVLSDRIPVALPQQ